MLIRCCVLCLLLLSAGCAAPRTGVTEDAGVPDGEVVRAFTSLQRPSLPRSRQQAVLPGGTSGDQVTPAALTALPSPDLGLPARPQPRPAMLKAARPLQCVPYARELSQIALRGNAWTWWQQAEGRYRRGQAPQPGAVMVFSKTRRLRLGHLAVVAEVKSSREIIVHQANWLNRGRIHRYTPVIDISENNDWSVVRVWYTPGRQYGSRPYPVYGFIYPSSNPGPEIRQAAN